MDLSANGHEIKTGLKVYFDTALKSGEILETRTLRYKSAWYHSVEWWGTLEHKPVLLKSDEIHVLEDQADYENPYEGL